MPLKRAVDGPHILAGFEELAGTLRTAGLLAEDATRAFAVADAGALCLTSAERGQVALAISAAKVVSTRLATEATSRIFEFIGARATTRLTGLDRSWRDARTLTVHDPVVYKARELGAFLLTGEVPPITAYG